ncbi:MAG: NAD(P)H-hydrate dehydratase [Ferruginibacter sp.]
MEFLAEDMIYQQVTKEEIDMLIKPRQADSHKGSYGHALLIAGSKGRMGAAVLAARACLRTGTGLLTVSVPEKERSILQTAIPEAMLLMRNDAVEWNKFSGAGIGPALGTSLKSLSVLKTVLEKYKKPLLLDADALTLLAGHKNLWPGIPAGSILTPHPAEFDRMFGESANHNDRMKKATELSQKKPWVIVLKNYQTLIAAAGVECINTTGNAGLAKGGSGDILSGMITALLAQGYASLDAAKIGVYLHGVAADIAIKNQSMESLLATDVIECIGKAFMFVQQRQF